MITHLILPPLPILHLGTSDYPPTFTTTCHFTPGLLQLLPIFPTTSNFTLSTQYHHTLQFPSWPLLITHPLSPPLSLSHLGALDYLPTFTTTSNFTLHHLQLPTSFDQHFHFHTWPVSITYPSWPPLPFAQHYIPDSQFPQTLMFSF